MKWESNYENAKKKWWCECHRKRIGELRMDFFEREMRLMFQGASVCRNAHFVGKTMLGVLDENLRAKLEFVSTRNNQQYDAIRVMIINREDGVVDCQDIKFSDVLGQVKRDGGFPMDYHVWVFREPQWITPIAGVEKRRVADAVLGYVSLFNKS